MNLVFITVLISMGFAEEVAIDIPNYTNDQFLSFLVSSIGGVKGMTLLGVIALISQVFMKFIGTPWAKTLLKNNGQWKLIAFLGFSLVSGVTALMISGIDFWAALMHSTTVAALGVLVHQLYKQIAVKKE